jgi:hypothetical protein
MGISIYFFFEINLDSNKNFSPLLESKLISRKNIISCNHFNIFKWNNTYLHLYEITCKTCVWNWKDTKIPKKQLKGHKDSKRHWKK